MSQDTSWARESDTSELGERAAWALAAENSGCSAGQLADSLAEEGAEAGASWAE